MILEKRKTQNLLPRYGSYTVFYFRNEFDWKMKNIQQKKIRLSISEKDSLRERPINKGKNGER
jgi:hypothetical protein